MEFTPIELPQLAKRLTASEEGDGKPGFHTSAARNAILLLPAASAIDQAVWLLEVLTSIQPARFFVVFIDPTLTALQCAIGERVVETGSGEKIKSEVVRISIPAKYEHFLPHVLRPLLIAGVESDLFLVRCGEIPRALIEMSASLADRMIFDSAETEQGLIQAARMLGTPLKLVDLNWLRLSAWKDQIRNSFSRHTLQRQIPQISTVTLRYFGGEQPPGSVLLLAGWTTEKMGLTIAAYGNSQYECLGRSGTIVALKFEKECDGSEALSEVVFESEDRAGKAIVLARLRLASPEVLETVSDFDKELRIQAPLDDLSLQAILGRFFLVGESIKNYNPALEHAIEFENLRKGYSVTQDFFIVE